MNNGFTLYPTNKRQLSYMKKDNGNNRPLKPPEYIHRDSPVDRKSVSHSGTNVRTSEHLVGLASSNAKVNSSQKFVASQSSGAKLLSQKVAGGVELNMNRDNQAHMFMEEIMFMSDGEKGPSIGRSGVHDLTA